MYTSKDSILINGSMRVMSDISVVCVPLSPLPFVLAADVLSVMFNHALESHVLHGVPLGRHGNVCHLQYVDDLIIFDS